MKQVLIFSIILSSFVQASAKLKNETIDHYIETFDALIDNAFSMPWDSRRPYYEDAESLMDSLIQIHPHNPDILARMAISNVQLLNYEDYSAQISRVQKVDSLTLHALELDSTHAISLVIRGILNYRLSNLSWIERFIVNTFIGQLPETSYEKSIAYLKKAIKFYKRSPYYYFALARTQLVLENEQQAKETLQYALSIPPENKLDKHYQNVAADWLKNLQEGKEFDLHHH